MFTWISLIWYKWTNMAAYLLASLQWYRKTIAFCCLWYATCSPLPLPSHSSPDRCKEALLNSTQIYYSPCKGRGRGKASASVHCCVRARAPTVLHHHGHVIPLVTCIPTENTFIRKAASFFYYYYYYWAAVALLSRHVLRFTTLAPLRHLFEHVDFYLLI